MARQRVAAGMHQMELRGRGLASGLYLYRLQAGRAVETRRMVRF